MTCGDLFCEDTERLLRHLFGPMSNQRLRPSRCEANDVFKVDGAFVVKPAQHLFASGTKDSFEASYLRAGGPDASADAGG